MPFCVRRSVFQFVFHVKVPPFYKSGRRITSPAFAYGFLPQERTQPGQCRLRPKSKYEIVKILLSYRKTQLICRRRGFPYGSAAFRSAYNFDNINFNMGKLPLQSQDCASYRRWSAKNVTNAKSVINAILMDTVSVICNQLYWIYMTNALSVSEYWKEEVCV